MDVQEIDLGKVVGSDGKSAYQAAVDAGYTKTESQFNAALESLNNAPFMPESGDETKDVTFRTLTLTYLGHLTFEYPDNPGIIGARKGEIRFVKNEDWTGTVKLMGISNPEDSNDAANKKYVDEKVGQVIPTILVKVITVYGSGETDEFNVKCYPAVGQNLYSMNYFVRNRKFDQSFSAASKITRIQVMAPQGYAFSGMYSYSGISIQSAISSETTSGKIWSEGRMILFQDFSDNISFHGGIITGSFTLEVE